MKKLQLLFLTLLLSFLNINESKACHALGVQNFQLTQVAGGVEVDAESTSPTCGCDEYWLDIEIRCTNIAFDGAPFDPTTYLGLDTYPYFQSDQMLKPSCVVQSYPTTTIPYSSLCPEVDYKVRVRENNNGNAGPWSNEITFTAPGTLDSLVIDIDASEDTICDGDSTTLTTNVTGGCGLQPEYTWSTGQTSQSITVDPTDTTTYTVSVYEICTQLTSTDSIEIIVNSGLDSGTAQISDDTICENQDVDIILTGYEGTIEWEESPNINGPYTDTMGLTSDTINYGPLTDDVCYRAIVTGCGTDKDTSNVVCVTVTPKPTLTISEDTICEGETTDLTSNVDLTGGTYLWTPTNQTSQDLTVSPSSNTTYELTYSLNGCSITDSSEVLVNDIPDVNFYVSDTCLNESSIFVDLSTLNDPNGDYINNYNWDFGDGTTLNIQDTSYTYSNSGTYNVTLVAETNFGCIDSLTQSLEVYDLPFVDFEVENNCLGIESDINLLTSNSSSTWDFGDGNVSNLDNPTYTYQSDGTYTITLTQEDQNGCVNDTTNDIEIYPKPNADFIGYDLESCSPLCFDLQSVSMGNIDEYIWTLSNGNEYSGQSISDCIENETTNNIILGVTLEVVTDYKCRDTATQNNYLTIYKQPTANFEYTPNNPNVLNSSVDFNNLSLNADYYTWNINENNSFTSENIEFDFGDDPGGYNIQLISYTDHCEDTTNGVIVVDDVVLFYVPNTFTPDNNGVNDKFKPTLTSGFDPFNYTLTIYNRWGELIFESNNSEIGWDGTYGGEVVKDGTYVWKISFKESMSDKKRSYVGHINILR